MTHRMEAVWHQIGLGETVCKKLKEVYWPTKPWSECYPDLPRLFTKLKVLARKAYSSEIEMLQALNKFTEQDIRDVLDV